LVSECMLKIKVELKKSKKKSIKDPWFIIDCEVKYYGLA
jgi:hypothetical protein